VAITYEVFVEWDMTDWSETPAWADTYHDISKDVQSINWRRGKEVESGNSPASTLEIRMKPGLVSKYSPFNITGVLYGKLLPWRIIRVRASNDGGANWWPVFFGYISKYSIEPHPEKKAVTIYCTDGTDLLARQIVTQDYDNRNTELEGAAVGEVLDAAGWSATRRSLDAGSSLLQYPATSVS
jgi:hypothetical protein